MKIITALTLFIFTWSSCQEKSASKKISFTTIIDSTQEHKDGFNLNGYVVSIPHEQAVKLHGKKVNISGIAQFSLGVKNYQDSVERQGRENDTWYIEKPEIEIIH